MPFLNDPNSSSSLADGPGKKKQKACFQKVKTRTSVNKE